MGTRMTTLKPLTPLNLKHTYIIGVAAIALSSILASCSKDDEPVRTNDPTTRAMTREDSIAAGLIIQLGVENGGEWDGETNYEF